MNLHFRNLWRSISGLSMCMAVAVTAGSAWSLDPTTDHVLEKWKELERSEGLEQKSYTVDFTIAVEAITKNGHEIVRGARTCYTRIKPGHVFLRIEKSGSPDHIYARSPRYAFAIRAASADKGTPGWAIARYHDDAESVQAREEEAVVAGAHAGGVLHPLSVINYGDVAAKWFGQSGMSLKPKNSTDIDRTQLDFTHKLGTGSLSLSPSHSSAVVHIADEITPPGPEKSLYRAKFSRQFYDEQQGREKFLPQCKEITYVNWDTKDNHERINMRCSYRDYSYDEIPEDIFYLSTYGLPEPVGKDPPPRKTPRYVWLLVAAGAFAFIAILFRWMKRRSRSKQDLRGSP